jgi:hypothetical protein
MTLLIVMAAISFSAAASDRPVLTPETVLGLAQSSADLVRVHDKEAWLELYGEEATIEDPVGGHVHSKASRTLSLARFYEVFIAPTEISFESHQDIVNADTVARNVTIHTRTSTGIDLPVHAYVFYRGTLEGGHPRVASMKAYWELPVLMQEMSAHGKAGSKTIAEMTARLWRYEKFAGLFGFAKALMAPLNARKRSFEGFLAAVKARETALAAKWFREKAQVSYMKEGYSVTAEEFLGSLTDLEVIKPVISGRYLVFTFSATLGGYLRQGIARAEFAPGSTWRFAGLELFE